MHPEVTLRLTAGEYARRMEEDDDLEEFEEDALSPIVAATVALHEMYCALIEGGFDQHEALRLIGFIMWEQEFGE